MQRMQLNYRTAFSFISPDCTGERRTGAQPQGSNLLFVKPLQVKAYSWNTPVASEDVACSCVISIAERESVCRVAE
jgi:hypothetical protein